MVGHLINHSPDAIAQKGDMEVDQKANGIAAESQIRQQLGLVDGQHLRQCFQLDEDSIFNKQVDAITDVDLAPAINDRNWPLDLHFQPLQDEFLMKAHAVCALEEAGPEACVYLDRRADDLTRDVVIHHRQPINGESSRDRHL